MIKQDTVIQSYRAFGANRGYSSNDSAFGPRPYQFMLLAACTIFKGWHDYPLYGRKKIMHLYYYDNVWADTLMQQGIGKGGFFGNFDPFTWEGFAQSWITSIIWGNLYNFIRNSIYASIFIV